MKIYNPKNKNGDTLVFKTAVSNIYDKNKVNLPNKINSITSSISTLQSSITSINTQVTNLNNNTYINPTAGVTKRTGTANICLLTDNKGTVTSSYGFTYDKLSAILATGSYSEYIKNGDWIQLTANDGAVYKLYANIDTYYNKGENNKNLIPHHIDFIADNLIYGSVGWQCTSGYNNNGYDGEQSPFLSFQAMCRGGASKLLDNAQSYFITNIPVGLRVHVVKKYCQIPYRYSVNDSALTDDNGKGWKYMTYLWAPYEREVFGTVSKSNNTHSTQLIQYHTFSSVSNSKIKYDTKTSTSVASPWWLASASVVDSTNMCSVTKAGAVAITYTPEKTNGFPLCFRFV